MAEGTFSRSSDIEASSVGDRLVLYHRGTRSALVLNPMASWLWTLLAVPRTDSALIAEIREQFPAVGEDRAGADLTALLDELVGHGFISREA